MIAAGAYCSFLVGLVLLVSIFFPLQAHADGGAPNLAYVSGASQGIGIIDVGQQKVAQRFAVTGDTYTILLSPDGRLLYVTQSAPGRVTALAAKTGQTICNATFPGHPSLLALSVDGTVLYAAGANEATIIAIDAQTCTLQHTFQAPEPISWLSAAGITTGNALHTQLWVAGMTAVSILDEQGQVLDSIPIEGGARFLCLPGALTAYVSTRQGSIVAVDMVTHQVFASLLRGGVFGPMDYDAITGDIYVLDQQHNQVDVLSPVLNGSGLTPQEPERVIHLNGSPRAIAITNDGQLGFVALSGGNVVMLDIPGRRIIKTIPVGGEPHFIITGPYPPSGVPVPQPTAASSLNITLLVSTIVLIIGTLAGVSWLIWKRKRGSYRHS
jgi:DNA-binding beta-propeller fold protein YncE